MIYAAKEASDTYKGLKENPRNADFYQYIYNRCVKRESYISVLCVTCIF